MTKRLSRFFDNYLKKEPLFINKKFLQANYTPEEIAHRDEQIDQIAGILAPALRMEKPSNIFCYGKTGCISGESLIYTNNGYVKIKDIDKNSRVLSFNIQTKEYEWSPFIFLRFENQDKLLLRINLDNGLSLTVTKDHPLLLSDMKWKKADEFKIEDEIVLGYDLPNITRNEIPLAMARLLGFVIADGSLNRRRRIVKDSKGYWYNSDKQGLRYFSDDLFLLSKVKEDINSLFKYGYTPTIHLDNNRCSSVEVVSQEICQALVDYGIPFGYKSYIIEVPDVVFKSSNVIQREFLKALFSGDGTVSTKTFQIEYYSNSKKLLEGISYLLYQEGISCKIRSKKAMCNNKIFNSYRLYIQRKGDLLRFYHRIGFYSQDKQKKLKDMFKRYKREGKFNFDNYEVSKIIKIEKVYEPYVYDLSVPRNHNFIANGIISHNSGKTVVCKHVSDQLVNTAKKKNVPLKIIYLNCKMKRVADTEYRIIAQLTNILGGKVPATGLPTDEVYKVFVDEIEKEKQLIIIILDEIDQLVAKAGDGILYNLTRMNPELKKAEISLIGISNDLVFIDNIDPRVKSSLSEEELVFPPYNALQLQDILKKRVKLAFRGNVVKEGVIEKCAAYAAREHGDARRALELLRVAGELAERKGNSNVVIKHLDSAEEKIERDRVLDIVNTQPKQFQLSLLSILSLIDDNKALFTGDVYELYKRNCKEVDLKPLTQRRVSDIVAELDMLGIINAKVISKGRYGRTREISLAIPQSTVPKIKDILIESLGL